MEIKNIFFIEKNFVLNSQILLASQDVVIVLNLLRLIKNKYFKNNIYFKKKNEINNATNKTNEFK